jgi:ankyrin repeat protein
MKQETPMHIAAENGYHEIIEIFLEILDNKNPPNANGWTPLHFAANRGHTECVRVILEETEV